MVDYVKSVDCLAIDDFGAERPSAWTIARLYDVINARVERETQTIVTTNYPTAHTLAQRLASDPFGAKRIVSRLVSFGWATIEGRDYRDSVHGAANSAGLTDILTDKIPMSDTVIDKMSDKSPVDGRNYRDSVHGAANSVGLTDILTKLTNAHSVTDSESSFLRKLLPCFDQWEWLNNATAREISSMSPASVKRYLRRLTELNILEARGLNKSRLYRLKAPAEFSARNSGL
jgi:DNA-binding transcriptional ArsR family regulator